MLNDIELQIPFEGLLSSELILEGWIMEDSTVRRRHVTIIGTCSQLGESCAAAETLS